MILQHINADTIGLKSGPTLAHIKTGGVIRVGEREIEGPGEYDIAGIGIHAYTSYAIIFTEGIRIAVVWQSDIKMNEEEDTDIDIFIFLFDDAKQINAIVKEQDPRLVILHNEVVADQLKQQDGIDAIRESNYKITPQTLPAEERLFILLV